MPLALGLSKNQNKRRIRLKSFESCESDGQTGHMTSAVVVETDQPKALCGSPLGPDSKEPIYRW